MESLLSHYIQEWLYKQQDLYGVQYKQEYSTKWELKSNTMFLTYAYVLVPNLGSKDEAFSLARDIRNSGYDARVVRICRTCVDDKFIVHEIILRS